MGTKTGIEDLLVKVKELDRKLMTGPWTTEANSEHTVTGNNWLLASFGNSSETGLFYFVVTDGVHCSEYDGDAKDDAEGLVELRNLLPDLIEVLAKAREEAAGDGDT